MFEYAGCHCARLGPLARAKPGHVVRSRDHVMRLSTCYREGAAPIGSLQTSAEGGYVIFWPCDAYVGTDFLALNVKKGNLEACRRLLLNPRLTPRPLGDPFFRPEKWWSTVPRPYNPSFEPEYGGRPC